MDTIMNLKIIKKKIFEKKKIYINNLYLNYFENKHYIIND